MDRPCDHPGCEYVAVDDAGEYKTGPGTRLSNHKVKVHGPAKDRPQGEPMEPTAAPPSEAEGTGPYGVTSGTGEVPPVAGDGDRSAGVTPPRTGGILGRFRKPKGAVKPDEVIPPRNGEKRPKQPKGYGRGGRQSAAETFADAWGWGGNQMQRMGHVPTGRMVRFQSPVAGELLDDLVKGTMVDKVVVQRLVAGRSKLDLLYAIAGPPAYTWQIEKAMAAGRPDLANHLMEGLKGCIRDTLPVMLPAMKKVRDRERKTNAAFTELFDEDDLAAMGIHMMGGEPVDADGRKVDVADVFVGMLFADWTAPTAPPAATPEPTEAQQ
jgi:hypothetical protein